MGLIGDVRDAAHVMALLEAPPLQAGQKQHKRLTINNYNFKWDELVSIIKKKYPELEKRLPVEGAEPGPQLTVQMDNSCR